MALVIDASVALTWCFADQASAETEAILEQVATSGATVPGLWHLELVNILSRAERLGRIDAAGVNAFLARLDRFQILTDTAVVPAQRNAVLKLTRDHGLTAYDAAYVELAQRLGAKLATQDKELLAAAAAVL
jgi:predicted nucleic acid-binding protein